MRRTLTLSPAFIIAASLVKTLRAKRGGIITAVAGSGYDGSWLCAPTVISVFSAAKSFSEIVKLPPYVFGKSSLISKEEN